MNYIQSQNLYVPQNSNSPYNMYNQMPQQPQPHVQLYSQNSPAKRNEQPNIVNIDQLIEDLFKPTYDKSSYKEFYYKGYSGDEIYYQDYNVIIEPTDELGGLFLGNLAAAQDLSFLKENNISAVLTVAKGSGLAYLDEAKIQAHELIEVEDAENQDLEKYFEQGCDFIENNRKITSVFVHCFAGVSRSASIIIAYLMKKYSLSFVDAFNYVRDKRSQIYPNNGFIKQLKSYEKKLKAQQLKQPQIVKNAHQNISNVQQNYQYYQSVQPQQQMINYQQNLNQNQYYIQQQSPELQSVTNQNAQTLPFRNTNQNLRNSMEQQTQQSGVYYVTAFK